MILAQSFGPTSSLSLPGIVTLPGFTEWRNCRWLPRVVTWYQPSRSTIRIASRTFGMGGPFGEPDPHFLPMSRDGQVAVSVGVGYGLQLNTPLSTADRLIWPQCSHVPLADPAEVRALRLRTTQLRESGLAAFKWELPCRPGSVQNPEV